MNFQDFFKTATGHEPCDYQCRLARLDRLVEEGDVARRNVQQINSEFFKCPQDLFDHRPARLELLPFFGLPVAPDILWKLGALIKVCAGEVENEGSRDAGHLDHAQFVVNADQLRHAEPQKAADLRGLEPRVCRFLPQVAFCKAQGFDGNIRRFDLAFAGQYDTVFSRAQPRREFEWRPTSIQPTGPR